MENLLIGFVFIDMGIIVASLIVYGIAKIMARTNTPIGRQLNDFLSIEDE